MARLYTSLLSANGRKTVSIIKHLRLDIDIKEVNVYRGEGNDADYLGINPLAKIPSLVDGELRLWESNAILVYLSERYADNALFSAMSDAPGSAQRRADILRWLFFESAHWQVALNRILAARVAQILFNKHDETRKTVAWRDAEIVRYLALLDQQLKNQAFVCGDTVTLADFSLAAMTTYFSCCDFPARKYPAIGAWCDRMNQIPAWRETLHPKWQPTEKALID